MKPQAGLLARIGHISGMTYVIISVSYKRDAFTIVNTTDNGASFEVVRRFYGWEISPDGGETWSPVE
jgi:hypothetical protein